MRCPLFSCSLSRGRSHSCRHSSLGGTDVHPVHRDSHQRGVQGATYTLHQGSGVSYKIRARFVSLARGKLRLCSANHRAGYFSNLACDWLSIVWAYSEQETENGPWRRPFNTLRPRQCGRRHFELHFLVWKMMVFLFKLRWNFFPCLTIT